MHTVTMIEIGIVTAIGFGVYFGIKYGKKFFASNKSEKLRKGFGYISKPFKIAWRRFVNLRLSVKIVIAIAVTILATVLHIPNSPFLAALLVFLAHRAAKKNT